MPRITKAYHTRVVAAYKGQVTRLAKQLARERRKKKPRPPKIVTKELGVVVFRDGPDDDPSQPSAFDEFDTWARITRVIYRLRLNDPDSGFTSWVNGELVGDWESHALGFIFRERVRAEIADWRAAHPGESPQASVVSLRIEGEA